MKIIRVRNYNGMSFVAFEILKNRIQNKPSLNMGFATGGTPVGTYQLLRESFQKKEISFKEIRSFNLDEYIGLDKHHPQSYNSFMFEHLFHHVDIHPEHVYIPSGVNSDIKGECEQYEALIETLGGIDLQILGIGSNGHIAFNEPGTSFHEKTHEVELVDSTIEANARFFSSRDEVPKKAITMGLHTIMKSKEIVLLISGKSKKEAFKKLLEGKITEEFPASILNNHPKVTVIVDEDAYL